MKFKAVGRTSVKIAAIGQGCAGIGGYLSKDSLRDENQVNALRLGIDLGMNFIDTAEVYGNGHSEEVIGKAIEGIRDKVFIATKVSPGNLFYNDLLESAEGSLRRLRTDYIDLYQIHWSNPKTPIAETMRAMEKLLKNGKIRYVGVCNFSLRELKEAESTLSGGVIVSIQAEYSLLERTIENTILPYCEKKNITTIAYSPLCQGRMFADHEKIRGVQRIAKKYNRTVVQIALNWLISHPSVVAIPKAANPEHVKENASSADVELSNEDFKEISRIFTQKYEYIPVGRIRIVGGDHENRQVYQTIEEAMENRLAFVPSPLALAQEIGEGEFLKPVKVMPSSDKTGRYDYDLIDGRIRYWAWVIAFNGEEPIPAYVCR